MPQDKISIVGTNIAEKATMIWNVADMLRGPFKPHEYGLVILPMTVVKRFHDCLLPTWQNVQDTYEKTNKKINFGLYKHAGRYSSGVSAVLSGNYVGKRAEHGFNLQGAKKSARLRGLY